jgi:hypothetical protein
MAYKYDKDSEQGYKLSRIHCETPPFAPFLTLEILLLFFSWQILICLTLWISELNFARSQDLVENFPTLSPTQTPPKNLQLPDLDSWLWTQALAS